MTSRTRAGDSALATKRAGSSLYGMMSMRSPRSSLTTMRTREPRGPTQAPTGSTPSACEIDGDLAAKAGFAGDVPDLDEAVGDLGHLELEQLAHEVVAAPREDDLRPLGGVLHLDDDRLDAGAVLVALGLDLLALGQQRLDAAELDQRVALVALLHDAGDELADAVDVLVVHEVALGLADALQDDLLGGLRGDAAEVVGRDLVPLDLALVDRREVEADLLALLVEHLERLDVDVVGEDELEDADVARLGVDLDLGVLDGVGRLLVRGVQRVFERAQQRLGADALLFLDLAQSLDDLSTHVGLRRRRT